MKDDACVTNDQSHVATAQTAEHRQSPSCSCRPNREKELLDAVMATLRGDGSVLMPIDTGGVASWLAGGVHSVLSGLVLQLSGAATAASRPALCCVPCLATRQPAACWS